MQASSGTSAPARAAGYEDLDFEVGELGFPSIPAPPASPEHTCADANEALQGAMIVRYLVTFRAIGARTINWHGFIGGVFNETATGWGMFASMGLRNDVIVGPASTYDRTWDAWRRAAWFAYHRTAHLAEHAESFDLVASDPDLVVVRITGRSPTSLDGYQYAYVAWKDAKATRGPVRSTFWLKGTHLRARYHAVPNVDASTRARGVGSYPTGETVTWDVSERVDITETRVLQFFSDGSAAFVDALYVTVYDSHPVLNPAPVIVLTDAVWGGVL